MNGLFRVLGSIIELLFEPRGHTANLRHNITRPLNVLGSTFDRPIRRASGPDFDKLAANYLAILKLAINPTLITR